MSKTKVLITIPVLNEEKNLEKNIKTLVDFLERRFRYKWEIFITDNGSTDRTPEIGKKIAFEYSKKENQMGDIKYIRIKKKGRGRALKFSWTMSNNDVLSYMDIDLSTNIEKFPKLIDKIVIDNAHIAIGSRLLKESRTTRKFKREIISRCYNAILKLVFHSKFSDAQCGFKAISKKTVDKLLPKIKDNSWFFDTELLLLAEHRNYKISEVPVEWIEDLNSSVNISKTVFEDILGIIRVKIDFMKEKIQNDKTRCK